MAKQCYEVQTNMLSGWENCWAVDGAPQRFDTVQEAEDDLNEFFADLARAGMAQSYDRQDYRIVFVPSDKDTEPNEMAYDEYRQQEVDDEAFANGAGNK